MNSHHEEKLLNCAFGDISPEEAMRIEAEAARDPELRQRLDDYQSMRAGLRSLGDQVPEHQLSNERLRDAILARGLSTTAGASTPTGPKWWQIAWMPVAAAAIAAVVFMAKPNRVGTPAVAIKQDQNPFVVPSIDAPTPSTAVAMRNAVDDALAARNYATVLAGLPPAQAAHPRSSEVVVRRSGGGGRTRTEPAMEMIASRGASRVTSTAPMPAPAPMAAAPGRDSGALKEDSAPHPIVLIDNETDTNTGASRATEVGSPSNVIVGG